MAKAGGPYKQNRRGMGEAEWRVLLGRWHAGEPGPKLVAEVGMSMASLHRNALELKLRKKDVKDAIRLAKGPPPVRLVPLTGGEVHVACAELSFTFHADDPAGTVRSSTPAWRRRPRRAGSRIIPGWCEWERAPFAC